MAYLAEMLYADHSYDTDGWCPSTGVHSHTSGLRPTRAQTQAWADATWPLN